MKGRAGVRRVVARAIAIAGALLSLSVVAWVLAGRHFAVPREQRPPAGQAAPGFVDEFRPQVTAFCGDCHATPSPNGFPKEAWHKEVKQGYDFYFDSGRSDLSLPEFDRVVAWFRDQAPESVVIPRQSEGEAPRRVSFRVSAIAGGHDLPPAVSFIKWCTPTAQDKRVLLWCDMRSGELRTADPLLKNSASQVLGRVAHPAHAEPFDPGDGSVALVVADLGSFLPADHADGKVVLLQRTEDDWQPGDLQTGLGRVADVEPGDFDGDGDVDLVVAEFGWRKTGRILLLENLSGGTAMSQFRTHVVDERHGAIHVVPVDLDGDGRLDFVALLSQEHETVVAFLNDGGGGFRRETLFAANEPAFGSSGIQLVDLDQDGDLDVLYTNGDTFDSFYPKPYHSIHWLENQGGFPFQDRVLAVMPGVQRALACDLDGDGDLDIVACSLLPSRILGRQSPADLDSLLWLEQLGTGKFVRHSLERETCLHAALDVGDFDGDGDIDLAVGSFSDDRIDTAITVWWNLRGDAGHARGP